MRKRKTLDELITAKGAEFADELKRVAKLATKEEEIRIAAERQLAFIEKETEVKLSGKHEFTVASGRIDSVYDRVIIEYKNPHSPGDRIGPKSDSPGSRKVVEQIKHRFSDLRSQRGQPMNSMFGVGLDGNRIIFVRFRNEQWHVEDPVEVDRTSAQRFLWALFNLGTKGKSFSPDQLAEDFGADAKLAQDGIRALYRAIRASDNPKAITFFKQWKILFGEVCGYDVDEPSDRIKRLAESYGVGSKGLKPPELLFALHTYYAVLMKLLASEIVVFFHRLPTPLKKMMQAGTSSQLRHEMQELESGSIFKHFNIHNFLEGDLFAWYTEVWGDSIEDLIRRLVTGLDDYNPGTLSEDLTGSRDLLKQLYQRLFPKSTRHDLGEYYTPDWLAEYVLDEVSYNGNPDKSLLDPACGSGTFLVMAINRIRRWHDQNREKCGFDESGLCRRILANVAGFDLNPLAVMAARTNYLIAIRDLVGRVDRVEIPVYLCDSVMTPSEYGDLFTGSLGGTKELRTAAARFRVPTEIAATRENVAQYAEQLEFCVRNDYSPSEFLKRCSDVGLSLTQGPAHSKLYVQLVQLDRENKDGVWARIIKNAFAPLFHGQADYVVGNPPWINWESLPVDYRESTAELWDKYRLRVRAIPGARLGNVKRELSALFVYVCMDKYVSEGGRLGFVITQSVFKTGANEGFRRFECAPNSTFRVERVTDMSLFLPFEDAINRTSVLSARKGQRTRYPVSYRLFVPELPRPTKAPAGDPRRDMQVEEWLAAPVEPAIRESAWLTAPREVLPALQKVVSNRSSALADRTYAGSCTWLNGVYWVKPLRDVPKGCLVTNLGDVGKIKCKSVTVPLENDHLYPLLRGRDVSAWLANPSAFIIVPHAAADFSVPLSVEELRRSAPLTLEYLREFEKALRSRSGYRLLHKERPEFYVVGNTGNYTLAPHKVVFKDLSDVFQCAVVGPIPEEDGYAKPVIPDHTLLFVACTSSDEAHFIAGMLNSTPSRSALYSASVGVQTQRYYPTDVSRIRLPDFDPKNAVHRTVVRLSQECHEIARADGGSGQLVAPETDLASAASDIWKIPDSEREPLMAYYTKIRSFRKRAAPSKSTEDE